MTQHSTKILLLDIETGPALTYVWGLWEQRISPNQLKDKTHLLSWAAKWYDESKMQYDSIHDSSIKSVVGGIYELLDEADVVVHFNGSQFDIPMLNREFIQLGWTPPSTYKQVDLLKTVRQHFRFPSNKLEYVVKELGLGTKIKTDFDLWLDCLAGKQDAWDKMEKYNKHDVVLLEKLYDKLMPWISNHPNHGLYMNKEVCPNCGGTHYQQRGYAYTKANKFVRYHCQDCGTWFKTKTAEKFGTKFRSI